MIATFSYKQKFLKQNTKIHHAQSKRRGEQQKQHQQQQHHHAYNFTSRLLSFIIFKLLKVASSSSLELLSKF
jgi:hypothetical protein